MDRVASGHSWQRPGRLHRRRITIWDRSSVHEAQVERLDGQLTRLARDYETLAATLRELWR
ncbi:MAG: hypothetical protein OXE58_11820 [Acidobacteria bacterium]|nr:hypothetical protein [Acidobacteriota bacterium]